MVFGVDEAGKGPVLGSMFVAAVSGDPSQFPADVDDSKSIPEGRRRELAASIRDRATAVYVVEIPVERIDDPEIGMNELTVAGHARAAAGVLRDGSDDGMIGQHGTVESDTDVDEVLDERQAVVGMAESFGNSEVDSKRVGSGESGRIGNRKSREIGSGDSRRVGRGESGGIGNVDDADTSTGRDGATTAPEAINEGESQGQVGFLDAGDTDEKRFERRVKNSLEPSAVLHAEHGADERYTVVGAASIIAKEARERHVESLAAKYGTVGSGYPSDPTTRDFLETYVRENRTLPPCARTSWGTSRDVLAALDQSTLTEF